MLIHSYIYYQLNDNLITDHQFDTRAAELVGLQAQLFMPVDWYDDAFADWTGASGAFLPFDHWVVDKANYLLAMCERRAAVVSFL
jgi:NAD-dependent DNA ligase